MGYGCWVDDMRQPRGGRVTQPLRTPQFHPVPLLQLHGPPRLLADDGRALSLSAREAALLAWLALEGPTPRARLADLLWPEALGARGNLRQTLLRLRRATAPLGALPFADEAEGSLRLAADLRVAEPGDEPLLGPLSLEEAPELAAWLQARRDDARRERQRRRLLVAQAALEAGRLDAVLAEADALLRDEPAQEEAHRLRMQAFYLRGDRAAAIAAWDECKQALRTAFGVTPSTATTELGRLLLASEATPPAPPAARQLPASLRRPPQRIADPAQAAAVAQAWQLGHALLFSGPGGLGKSRWLSDLAAGESLVLRVAAEAGDAPGALLLRLVDAALERFAGPWPAGLLAQLEQLRAPPAGISAAAQQQLLAAPARLLASCAAQGLGALLLDDLQAADALSLAGLQPLLVDWLADRLPLRLLLGARLHEAGDELLALLAPLRASGRCLHLELRPLDADALRALLGTLALPLRAELLPELAAALQARLGGNPGFVLESLKALWLAGLEHWQPGEALPVPPGLLEAVRRRLDRLPPEALQLAQLAALARAQFSLQLAGRALQRAPLQLAPLLAQLEAAQVFHGPRFAHELVAEAVQASLPASLREPLHQLIAEQLIALDAAPQGIAQHLDAAGQPRAAADWHRRAAEAARQRWQLAQAAEHDRAAALAYRAPQDRPLALQAWRAAAHAHNGVDAYDAAWQALEAGSQLARTDAEHLPFAGLRLAVLHNTRRFELLSAEVASLLARLQRLADAGEPPPAEALGHALEIGATMARVLPLPATLPALLRRLAQLQPAVADRAAAAEGALLQLWGRPREALALLDAPLRAARQAGRHDRVVNLGHPAFRAALAAGEAARAAQWAAQMEAAVIDGGLGPDHAAHVAQLGLLQALAAGDLAAARAAQQAVDQRLAGLPPSPLLCLGEAALALAEQQPARAAALLAPLDERLPGVEGCIQAWLAARCARAAGHSPAPWLQRALALDPSPSPLPHRLLAIALQQQPADALPALQAEAVAAGQQALADWAHSLRLGAWPAGALRPLWLS